MRLRKKPWAEAEIKANPRLVPSHPREWRGRWDRFFANHHPIRVEIGTGKGQFLARMAQRYPRVNFIGVELQASAVGMAVRTIRAAQEQQPFANLCLVQEDAQGLTEFFAPGEIERIYLNFSDPWPKRRHSKRRLTHPSFLKHYQQVLMDGGEIHFKTDNEQLFEYSLNSFSDFGCRLRCIRFDLHSDIERLKTLAEQNPKVNIPENVMTEYEEKFASQGMRIYSCEAIVPAMKR